MISTSTPAIAADPFREHAAPSTARRFRVLGCDFEFEPRSSALAQLIEHAYAGLPRHELSGDTPHLKLSLAVSVPARGPADAGVPRIETLSGGGLLCGATTRSSCAVISPTDRSALIVVSREMLRHAYHVRYELIEFSVFTLAARVRGLVPLHAACLGRAGCGVLVMGESGAGKSTAALHCALGGLELVSEDSTFVEPHSLLATGVANFLHIRRESLRFVSPSIAARLRRFPVIRRRSGVAKLEIDLRRTHLPLAPGAVRVEAIVFAVPRRVRSGQSLLVPLRPDSAQDRLEAAQPYAARRPEWPLFTQRVATVPAFELRRGRHPQEAASALATLLPAKVGTRAADARA